jgi:hypothetical protein
MIVGTPLGNLLSTVAIISALFPANKACNPMPWVGWAPHVVHARNPVAGYQCQASLGGYVFTNEVAGADINNAQLVITQLFCVCNASRN